MSAHCCHDKGHELERMALHKDIRRVLIIVMMLNAMMFVLEFGAGLVARSASLMADSVDMLGDALVYAISLYALNRSLRWRAGSALLKGAFILTLGLGVIVEIGIKMFWDVPPASAVMLLFGGMALAANLSCLALLWPYRRHDVNLASTFECSRNDVVANLGVLAAAGLVSMSGSAWPDIVVAAAIAFMFLRSSLRVIADAWPQYRSTLAPAE
ncbi:MAG: cation transporter [Alphaproteobacteria bacterium]|nr:cation transporter [Alphaproteobacteria bacterium]MBV9370187.1 cation transporter [Alphaproteobacteria bacterium]MBV9902420.1 cation transporter [Alphaproteobacteria bacterium]